MGRRTERSDLPFCPTYCRRSSPPSTPTLVASGLRHLRVQDTHHLRPRLRPNAPAVLSDLPSRRHFPGMMNDSKAQPVAFAMPGARLHHKVSIPVLSSRELGARRRRHESNHLYLLLHHGFSTSSMTSELNHITPASTSHDETHLRLAELEVHVELSSSSSAGSTPEPSRSPRCDGAELSTGSLPFHIQTLGALRLHAQDVNARSPWRRPRRGQGGLPHAACSYRYATKAGSDDDLSRIFSSACFVRSAARSGVALIPRRRS